MANMAQSGAQMDETELQILEFVQQQPGRFVATPEIAEELDMTTNGASYRLKQLQEKGEIESRIPSRDEIWYIPEREAQFGASAFATESLFPTLLDREADYGLGLYSSLLTLFVILGYHGVMQTTPNPAAVAVMVIVGAALPYVAIFFASMLIAGYQKFWGE